jgi:hypothetical protein
VSKENLRLSIDWRRESPENSAMADWRFDQPGSVAAVTSAAVLAGAPILVVVHYSDDASWGFFDGASVGPAEDRVVSMGEALSLDPSLDTIADLPPGWVARRASSDGAWIREPRNEV